MNEWPKHIYVNTIHPRHFCPSIIWSNFSLKFTIIHCYNFITLSSKQFCYVFRFRPIWIVVVAHSCFYPANLRARLVVFRCWFASLFFFLSLYFFFFALSFFYLFAHIYLFVNIPCWSISIFLCACNNVCINSLKCLFNFERRCLKGWACLLSTLGWFSAMLYTAFWAASWLRGSG